MTAAKLSMKLDEVFSEYVRRRDSDKHTGIGWCCTCPTYAHWKDMHCGHCVRRGNHSVRWDVRNADMQCPVCNNNGGKTDMHEQWIAGHYDWDTVDELVQLGRETRKFTCAELREKISEFKKLLKAMPKT